MVDTLVALIRGISVIYLGALIVLWVMAGVWLAIVATSSYRTTPLFYRRCDRVAALLIWGVPLVMAVLLLALAIGSPPCQWPRACP